MRNNWQPVSKVHMNPPVIDREFIETVAQV